MRLLTRALAPLAIIPALLVPAGGAAAAPAESTRSVSTNVFSNLGCSGETAPEIGRGSATLHLVTKTQSDGSFQYHLNIHGELVGNQGNEYVLNWTRKYRSESGEFTRQERIVGISKGSAPNTIYLLTFNSNGNNTFERNCRG